MRDTINQYFDGNYKEFYQRYLPDIKKDGKEYKAQCPFHRDTNPSLSINPEKGLFHCFGCKNKGDIFKFYAIKNRLSLYGDFSKICKSIVDEFNISAHAKQKFSHKKKFNGEKGKIIQTYDYRDAKSGDLLFQKVRRAPKVFYIRRPDINGGWKKNLGKIMPVLYRLPDIIDANEVNITEGEKDADNLLS